MKRCSTPDTNDHAFSLTSSDQTDQELTTTHSDSNIELSQPFLQLVHPPHAQNVEVWPFALNVDSSPALRLVR